MLKKVVFALSLIAAVSFATNASADSGVDILENTGTGDGLTFGGGAFVAQGFGMAGLGGLLELIEIIDEFCSDDDMLMCDDDTLINNGGTLGELDFNG